MKRYWQLSLRILAIVMFCLILIILGCECNDNQIKLSNNQIKQGDNQIKYKEIQVEGTLTAMLPFGEPANVPLIIFLHAKGKQYRLIFASDYKYIDRTGKYPANDLGKLDDIIFNGVYRCKGTCPAENDILQIPFEVREIELIKVEE